MSLPPFQALLNAHGRDVHRFLIATVGRSDADDCYQDTWLAALRAYPRLRGAANLRGWIFTIAHRKAIDHIRSTRRRALPVSDVPEGAEVVPSTAGAMPAAVHPAEDRIAASDGVTDLWSRVRNLPNKQRTAVALRYVTDASYAEISSVMGTSEEAARRNVHEGLKRLRTEYER